MCLLTPIRRILVIDVWLVSAKPGGHVCNCIQEQEGEGIAGLELETSHQGDALLRLEFPYQQQQAQAAVPGGRFEHGAQCQVRSTEARGSHLPRGSRADHPEGFPRVARQVPRGVIIFVRCDVLVEVLY